MNELQQTRIGAYTLLPQNLVHVDVILENRAHVTTSRYTRFNALKNGQPELKTLLGVGGWTFGTQRMTSMLESKTNRDLFITTAILFLRKRGFDGIDLDFEYPASRGSPPEDKARYAQLVQVLLSLFYLIKLAFIVSIMSNQNSEKKWTFC